ncbi:protein kinase [Mycobacterium paraense]|uniref:non-specific serine/threonine protein kinase n=1 Tax=Mycobacterium paraense TaxID=767916 RepID=A0ABX3VK02_9MYCO|nr:protein kinase [Mycobacterium paraense]MCV7442156.1 protein kinase [Mycobacterium paraense]ORW29616.1 protein kinase [Mycobacterium paraense]ORW35945.1 protein kinase [Mycobacterium paraense]ORW43546.1 protein kinase [Mycobacterium paraense]
MSIDPESFGHYQILELLGRGGMGRVYRAFDASTDRVVALKVLPPHLAEDQDFQHRFRREARIAAGLNDPHIVPIHGYGEIDGQLYVDMRLIEGRDLSQYIDESGGRLSPERTVAVIEQVAAALDSAHRVGLVHRDIKPKNILVTTAQNFVYLIDFGLARAESDTQLTHTGATMGTVAYLAPERFRGTTDHRADVYSLACVLYECLTGSRPYPGDSLEEQLHAHVNAPPPRASIMAPGIPPAFDAVISRGMAKDPEARYQSAIELAEAARAALTGHVDSAVPPPAAPAPAPEPPRPSGAGSSNRRLVLGIVGGSLVALAAVVALVISLVTQNHGSTNTAASSTPTRARVPARPGSAPGTSSPAAASVPPLPAFAPPPGVGANCQYPPSPDPASKPASLPPSGRVSTEPATIHAVISTNFGDLGVQLANNESPCTVNSFVSLAKQGFFDNTICGRMIDEPEGGTLLFGGGDADGGGGAGYEYADEYPTNQYKANDPELKQTVIYPRGTVAMATNGPNTNESQFFIVFRDAEIEPTSTVFGAVDQAGLDTLDKMARVGVAGNRTRGMPTSTITINSVRVG